MGMYDSIRKIRDKDERIKMMIQQYRELSALELYQLALDFSDEEVLLLLGALKDSVSSFSLQSLLGLIKSGDKLIPALLAVKENLALNDLTLLLSRIGQPVVKLQAIQCCKDLLNEKAYISLLTSKNNVVIAEKIIDIWNYCPTEKGIKAILDTIEDSALRSRLAECFLQKRNFSPERIAKLKALDYQATGNFERIGFESGLTFGVELEFGLLESDETLLWDYVCGNFRKEDFHIKSDLTLVDGSEITTPVLTDCEKDWERLARVCKFIKNIGGVIGNDCGTHIHFGANVFEENPKIFRNFLQIWQEVEPLIYMISNMEGEKTEKERKDSIKPVAGKIQEMLLNMGNKQYSISEMISGLHLSDKGYSVNFRNILAKNQEKYTIEFRLANGTLDYENIRRDAELYARLLNLAKELTQNPEYKKKEQEEFFRVDIDENKKLDHLLNLLFESEEKKQVYVNRLDSVKDEGFIIEPRGELKFQPSFIYKEMRKMAMLVPGYLQEEALSEILEMSTERDISRDVMEH